MGRSGWRLEIKCVAWQSCSRAQSTNEFWEFECVYVCLQRVLLFPLTSSCTTFEWLLDPMARLPGALMRPTSRGLRGSCCHANGAEQNAACQVVCRLPIRATRVRVHLQLFPTKCRLENFCLRLYFSILVIFFLWFFLSSVFWHSTESGERLANSATPFRVFFF